MPSLELTPTQQLLISIAVLMLATQLVIVVLAKLEKHQFGPVFLGTLITPLCTGFPNLMIGLFGQERLQGDLVLQLNIGNNLANTSLITGVVILFAGPLRVRPKGSAKKALKEDRAGFVALAFLWIGSILVFFLAKDGEVSRLDGLLMTGVYFLYQIVANLGRGKVPAKKRLGLGNGLLVVVLLGAAAWMIQFSLNIMGSSLEHMGDLLPGAWLGMFLGLLTVIPESFLLLRLALQKGTLGFSGLVGDCFVSIPLVVGLSAVLNPFQTGVVEALAGAPARPYLLLAGTMTAFSILALRKQPVSRKTGLIFIALYAMVWVLSRG